MCGRYAMNDTLNELITEYVAGGGRAEEWAANYNIAPTQHAPIVREHLSDDGALARDVELATWGFWPAWVKAQDKRPHPINARLETVATNGMFRNAFAERRCIVPMRGYYEWVTEADGKQPHFIHQAGGDLLSAAGLYAFRKDEAGQWQLSYTVLTRQAQDASGEVHDRMPVFLPGEMRETWLQPAKLSEPDGMLAELDQASRAIARSIVTYPVGRTVNNARTADASDPSLIAPLSSPSNVTAPVHLPTSDPDLHEHSPLQGTENWLSTES